MKTLLKTMALIGLIFWGCQSDIPTDAKNDLPPSDNDKAASAEAKKNIGINLVDQGRYAEALQNYLEALRIYEKIGDQNSIGKVYNQIGIIYAMQGNDKMALDYFLKDLFVKEKFLKENSTDTACQNGRSVTLNNIGLIFERQDNYKQALSNYFEALKIAEEIGAKKNISLYCNNIGNVYRSLKDYRNSYLYLERGLKIKREISDKEGESRVLMSLSMTEKMEHKFAKSLSNLKVALELAQQIGNKNLETEIYYNLAKTYAETGNYAKAYEYYGSHKELSDSLLNTESTEQIAEMQTKYETEKKTQKILSLNKDLELQDAKVARQKIVIVSVALLVVVACFFVFWFFRTSKKEREAKLIIAEQHKEIKDSVNYALRIQKAMLPKLEDIKKALPESFVFYQPKDIVSGDFYWFHSIPALNKEGCPKDGVVTFIAACDCTGHGVPGALTSAFCSTALDEAVKVTKDPAEMLSFANAWVKRALKQSSGETKDGMDIALVKIEKIKEGAIIHYAGANRPLYIARNNAEAIEEVKADKTAIGGFTDDNYRFGLKLRTLDKGESFFISSDGFADQFGGPKGKKITTKAMKERLLMIRYMAAEAQTENLGGFMANWMKNPKEQVDDFLVIGVKIV